MLYLTQKDIWFKGYSYSTIKEEIEKLGSKPVKDYERINKLPHLFAVTETYKLPFNPNVEVDISAKEMARNAFGRGSNTAKQYAASFFANAPEKVKDQAPALSMRKSFNK